MRPEEERAELLQMAWADATIKQHRERIEFANRVRALYGGDVYDEDDARWLSRDEAAHHGPPFGDA